MVTKLEAEKCQVFKRNTQQHFTAPTSIVIGPEDEIFVLDYTNPKIIIFKQDLTKQKTITRN